MMVLTNVVEQGQAALHSLAVLIVLHCAAPAKLQVSVLILLLSLPPTLALNQ